MKSNIGSVKNKQDGGTILGIVIGLVIGLTIAVVVALMITKSSTPFTNKLGLTKADAPTIQLTDPNKPLYGSSAKEIMANANKVDASTADASTANAPALPDSASSANQTVAVRPADNVKQEAAKTDTRSSKPADAVVAKNDTDQNAPAYYLQVGAFHDSADAESARAKLALIGVESRVSTSEGDNLYRVRVGPFDQLDTMNRMRSKLSENSIDVAVIKTPK